jgi:CDP-diacylglycerol--serine O-phosphatidyltransferase
MSNVKRGVYILPNLFTSANLFFGFYAIIHALKVTLNEKYTYHLCAYFILLAAVFDMMDGRVARKYNSASKFGIEYDSLCDLVSFGVAPALVTYLWMFQSLGRLGWVVCFLYIACAALRLGRFNVQAASVESKHFQGLPVPMAALLICGMLVLWKGQDVSTIFVPVFINVRTQVLLLMFLVSLVMVSSIPYRNTKSLSLRQRLPFYYLFLGVLVFVIFAMKPLWIMFGIGLLYFLSGPLEWTIRAILKKPMQGTAKVPAPVKSENKDVRLVHPKNQS